MRYNSNIAFIKCYRGKQIISEGYTMKTTIQALIMIVAVAGCQAYGQATETTPPVPEQESPEVLNQGPIHEGYAQPLDLAPQAGILSPAEPPAEIVENPAAERPKGSEFVWIPGYWAWDTDRTDHVWVSGCWRVPPTGMSWMPGYWNKTPQGYQWVAGFWIPTPQAKQIQYLPPPPPIEYVQPSAVIVDSGLIWVPPCYYWRDNAYVLRAGYWLTPQNNWVWVPSHYSWTPNGFVFVPGYWDYTLSTRGILYAPVYFPRHFHRPPGYAYSLGVVVDIGNLEFSLFSSPRYCHYYFGDYYNDSYISVGIFPWFESQRRHSWYDPIYEYDRFHYRDRIPHWDQHIRHEYDLRRSDPDLRPPRTYHELESRIAQAPEKQRNDLRMVEPIKTFTDRKAAPIKYTQMNDSERRKVVTHANDVNTFRQERKQLETKQPAPTAVRPTKQTPSPDRTAPEPTRRVDKTIEQPKPVGPVEKPTPAPDRTAPEPGRRVDKTIEQPKPVGPVEKPTPAPDRTAPEPTRRVDKTIEQPKPAEQVSPEKKEPQPRVAPEKMNFPKSPITGKSSRGIFQEKTPSQSDKEGKIERQPDQGAKPRGDSPAAGDRGRR
jgi:hypothetical protein